MIIVAASTITYDASVGVLLALILFLTSALVERLHGAPAQAGAAFKLEVVALCAVDVLLVVALVWCFRSASEPGSAPMDSALIRLALLGGVVAVLASPMPRLIRMLATRRRRAARMRAAVAGALVLVVGMSLALRGGARDDELGPRFLVWKTCLDGGCGLNQRTGPGPQFPTTGRMLDDGTEVEVVCTTIGRAPPGGSSTRWDLLSTGRWVSDEYIDRPKDGGTPLLPECPEEAL